MLRDPTLAFLEGKGLSAKSASEIERRTYGTIWRGGRASRSRPESTGRVAVKVIDDCGNQLVVVGSLKEAEA